jgi:meiotic recombination protein REC8
MDVEMGRDAPSSLFDDHSLQMPWNITASIQSSRHGHRYGSVSELSSRARNGSIGPRARGRQRLTSASPLAGHGYRAGQERLSSMELLGDFGDDLDLTRYLEGELATDRETIGSISSRRNTALKCVALTLDRESLNFLDFIKSKLEVSADDDEGSVGGSPGSTLSGTISTKTGQTTFATLLPLASTTRAVATQGLMNLLTLATKGVVDVHQGPYVDESTDGLGVRYRYGEILLRLSGM